MKEKLEAIAKKINTSAKSQFPISPDEKGALYNEIEEIILECENIINYSEYLRKEIRIFPNNKFIK
jgi:hypothetical protein